VNAVVTEIQRQPPDLPEVPASEPFRIGSIFLGGGTPSLLSPLQIGRILDAGREWDVVPGAEITIEANPDDPSLDYLRAIREAGVNRLSFGVQSFDDTLLRKLGRRHGGAKAIAAFDLARQAGFDNVSIDLMFALPGQTLALWEDTVARAVALEPDHLSLYNLTVETGTPFGDWAAAGKLSVPDDDAAADMYELAIDRLGAAGYRHYEISNWAHLDGERDLRAHHNLRYWRNQPYFGIGAGAHSSYAGHRYANLLAPREYIARQGDGRSTVDSIERIEPDLEMGETMLLGLRLDEGVEVAAFHKRFNRTPDDAYGRVLAELRDNGLLAAEGDPIRLTQRGRLLGNEVFYRFLPPTPDVTGSTPRASRPAAEQGSRESNDLRT
jgi:oxygen-independent coproporphyrinogen-3 oxidase